MARRGYQKVAVKTCAKTEMDHMDRCLGINFILDISGEEGILSSRNQNVWFAGGWGGGGRVIYSSSSGGAIKTHAIN